MADGRGWWDLKTTVTPNDVDLEHIASMIKQGYTNGEICDDEVEGDGE